MEKIQHISILKELEYNTNAYLVGGTVRDMVIGKEPADIDIVVTCDAERFARALSKKIDGTLFLLDKERGVFRVVLRDKSQPFYYDISLMRGADIYADLSLRDFTVDAMAIRLADDAGTIIDPYNGQADIVKKCIRTLSQKSFEDDPLRLLRAFRLAGILEFEIDTTTFHIIKEMSSALRQAAKERIRDEFFRLLSSPRSIKYLQQMEEAGLLSEVLTIPKESDIKKGMIVFERLECLYNTLPALFSPFDVDIGNYLQKKIENEITNAALWKWISLFIPDHITKELTSIASRALRLSNKACRLIHLAVEYIQPSLLDKGIEDKRSICRLFKAAGNDGIGLILCQIASLSAGTDWDDRTIKNGKDVMAWYLQKYKKMKDFPLITGDDLIVLFNITPGPMFGYLIDIVEESRAMGYIATKNDAVSLLKKLLTNV